MTCPECGSDALVISTPGTQGADYDEECQECGAVYAVVVMTARL